MIKQYIIFRISIYKALFVTKCFRSFQTTIYDENTNIQSIKVTYYTSRYACD